MKVASILGIFFFILGCAQQEAPLTSNQSQQTLDLVEAANGSLYSINCLKSRGMGQMASCEWQGAQSQGRGFFGRYHNLFVWKPHWFSKNVWSHYWDKVSDWEPKDYWQGHGHGWNNWSNWLGYGDYSHHGADSCTDCFYADYPGKCLKKLRWVAGCVTNLKPETAY